MSESTTYIENITPALPHAVRLLSPGDVHLGASNRSAALLEILSSVNPEILVLNGDFLETSEIRRLLRGLSENDLALLHLIEEKRHTGMRVVYTIGNHDRGVRELLADLEALTKDDLATLSGKEREKIAALLLMRRWEIQEFFMHEYRGVKSIHIHGDQWDHIVRGKRFGKLVASVGSFFWDLLKRIDREKHYVAGFTKRRVKLVTNISNQVAAGAVEFAKNHGATYAIAGHTHDPWEFSVDGIHYINVGGFDMYESGMLSVGSEGAVTLHKVQARRKAIPKPHSPEKSEEISVTEKQHSLAH